MMLNLMNNSGGHSSPETDEVPEPKIKLSGIKELISKTISDLKTIKLDIDNMKR